MSTRAVVSFEHSGNPRPRALVYVHVDGDLLRKRLARFLAGVERQTRDTRFGDPSYLAAKFVVWLALVENAQDRGARGPLDFLGVGVVQDIPSDADYVWHVQCASHGTPSVNGEPYEPKTYAWAVEDAQEA